MSALKHRCCTCIKMMFYLELDSFVVGIQNDYVLRNRPFFG